MLSRKVTVGLLLTFAITASAEAQGGLIKRKIGDALKKKADPAQKNEAASNEPKFRFAFNEASMASFRRGLETEIRLRDEFRAQVAKNKTPKQYEDCKRQSVMTEEGQKISMEYVKVVESGKGQDELMKAAEGVSKKMDALVLKQCGEDPNAFIRSQAEVFRRAERAGAAEFAKGWTRTAGSDDAAEDLDASASTGDYAGASQESDTAPVDLAPTVAFLPTASCASRVPSRPFSSVAPADSSDEDSEYRYIKELIEKYCQLSSTQQSEAQANGIQVAGSQAGINWVFTKGFANWIGDLCRFLMELLAKLA